MFKFVTIGDMHYDKNMLVRMFGSKIHSMQSAAAAQVLRDAVVRGIEHAIFLGDVGDKPVMSQEASLSFIRLLTKFSNKINIHIILGNHDIRHKKADGLAVIKWMCDRYEPSIKVYSSPTSVNLGGVNVDFMPFPHHESLGNNRLCFGHFSRVGATNDNGKLVDEDLGGHRQVDKDNKWIIGHIHTRQRVGNSWYPGTLYQTSFGERTDKGYMIGVAYNDEDGLQLKCKWEKVKKKFDLITEVVKTEDDWKRIQDTRRHGIYKIQVKYASDLTIPNKFLQSNTNIVRCTPISEEEQISMEDIMRNVDSGSQEFSLDRGLKEFLLKKGLDKSGIIKAKKMLREAMDNIS